MTTETMRREAVEPTAWLLGVPESLDYLHGAPDAGGRLRDAEPMSRKL